MQTHPSAHTDTLLPTRALLDRYDVTDRTVFRWNADEKLNFPKPIEIRGRKYWRLAELETWERSLARRGKRSFQPMPPQN